MNRTLDVEIRRAMAELAQAAPLPRPVEVVEAAGTSSVRAMSAPARRRTWAVAAASFAAGALVVGIVVVVERGDHRPRTQSVSPATIDSTVPMAIFSYPFVAAVVVTSMPATSDELVIDEGSDRGILVGMPVLNGAGLVGRVVRVERNRSVVLLATSPDFAVACVPTNIDGEGATAGVGGCAGDGRTLTMQIPADSAAQAASLAVGDIVETAGGTNSLAPAGIPVGSIESIRVGVGGENTVLTLRWAAAELDLTTVSVVLYVPDNSTMVDGQG